MASEKPARCWRNLLASDFLVGFAGLDLCGRTQVSPVGGKTEHDQESNRDSYFGSKLEWA
jgi:hypothetical protein